jgi:hypothetical protein
LPDDAGHFVTIQLDERGFHLDLGHMESCYAGVWAGFKRRIRSRQLRGKAAMIVPPPLRH